MTRTRSCSTLPGISLTLLLTLGVSGCQAASDAAPAKGTSPATSADAEADVVLIRALTPGDRACYIELENKQGQRTEAEASFELCEQPQLIGQRVRLTRERTNMPAMSCEGDPECTRTDSVELIISAEVL
ncbi:MAG: hypothetical protein V4812_02905 [Pseudomonadota bacterium]